MTRILVDSNVILDVLTDDPQWFTWSATQLAHAAETGTLHINPIIYAEVSIGFQAPNEVESVLSPFLFRREVLPYAAAFLAGKAFQHYRQRGGTRRSPLPDFYIGAHALTDGYTLLSRDVNRYHTYFPDLQLLSP